MEHITLNAKQIAQLVKNKYVELKDSTIELYEGSLILNRNGDIYNITSIDAQFVEREIQYKQVIDFIQNLICQHLNFNPNQVIYSKKEGEEFEFRIKITPNQEWQLVVCEARRAVSNVKFYFDETENISINAPYIGFYKQLGQSFYYFRWFEDI